MAQTSDNQVEPTPSGAQPKGGLFKTVREWAEMIKIEHTVFALPFALSGMILATRELPSALTVLWVVLAFLGARCAAMTLNRIIDAEIDGRNPRTQMRSIPAGRINKAQAWVFAILSFALMLFAASNLPRLCLTLSPIAIVWLSIYSYTKRFTWLCHFVLGIALGGGALGGWIASSGTVEGAAPWLLALAVTTWVAGFDLIYACQDVTIDRDEHLHSLPAKFGIKMALDVSVILHLVTAICLSALGVVLSLGLIYWIGVSIVCAMLAYEHDLVKPNDLSKLNAAFFNINGIISILIFVAILLDKLTRVEL
ncbi:MAG TPA: UbiA-like polyprenyltransferase [Planktothrix sp.]|jgi:4-hydroxybenzoate polyprenyltransferase